MIEIDNITAENNELLSDQLDKVEASIVTLTKDFRDVLTAYPEVFRQRQEI